jgi:hypothetical protein
MQRIEGATATKDNKFTEGDLDGNIPSTIVTADFLNSIQEEIANVIEEDGIKLDLNDNKQLSKSINKKIKVVNDFVNLSYKNLIDYYNTLRTFAINIEEIAKKQKNSITSDNNKSSVVADTNNAINLKSGVINFLSDSLKWNKQPVNKYDLVNKEYLDYKNLKYTAFVSNCSSTALYQYKISPDISSSTMSTSFEKEFINRLPFKVDGNSEKYSLIKSFNSIISYNNKNKNNHNDGLILNRDGCYLFDVNLSVFGINFVSHSSLIVSHDLKPKLIVENNYDLCASVALVINKSNSDYKNDVIKDKCKIYPYVLFKKKYPSETPTGIIKFSEHNNYSFKFLLTAKKNDEFSIAFRVDNNYYPSINHIYINYIVDVKIEYFDE